MDLFHQRSKHFSVAPRCIEDVSVIRSQPKPQQTALSAQRRSALPVAPDCIKMTPSIWDKPAICKRRKKKKKKNRKWKKKKKKKNPKGKEAV